MPILTLFEYERKPYPLTAHQLALLDQMQRRRSEPIIQPVYHAGTWHLRAGSHVGVVRLGAQTVQILPKIYRSAPTAAPELLAREATTNLLYMLAYAGMVQIRDDEVADLLSRESDWFELLTYLFARRLTTEWQHGPVRRYQTVEDELPLLKGKWRLEAQFRGPDRAHRFTVAYDEFTVDIPLNRVFRFVVERLSRVSRSMLNRRLLGDLRSMLDDVTLLPVMTIADAEQITLDRLSARYEPLLNLARLFLDGGALQIAGGETSLFAFVFDMNQLFEGFIAGFLRRHRSEALPAELQSSTIVVQSRGIQRHLAQSEGKPFFRLKPDLLLHQESQVVLIADTKYKTLNADDRKLGISEADFYQMFAYAQRFACSRVLLLYPQHAGIATPLRKRFQLEDRDAAIYAATIDIRRNLGSPVERRGLAAEFAELLRWR